MCGVVLAMFWIPSFRTTRSFPSGTGVPGWDSLLVFQGSILQPGPLCATYTQDMYISPQCHVVFDDKFEIVFSGGKSEEETDEICQKLFDGEREN